MNETRSEKVFARVRPSEKEQLEQIANEQDIPISHIIRAAVREKIDQYSKDNDTPEEPLNGTE